MACTAAARPPLVVSHVRTLHPQLGVKVGTERPPSHGHDQRRHASCCEPCAAPSRAAAAQEASDQAAAARTQLTAGQTTAVASGTPPRRSVGIPSYGPTSAPPVNCGDHASDLRLCCAQSMIAERRPTAAGLPEGVGGRVRDVIMAPTDPAPPHQFLLRAAQKGKRTVDITVREYSKEAEAFRRARGRWPLRGLCSACNYSLPQGGWPVKPAGRIRSAAPREGVCCDGE